MPDTQEPTTGNLQATANSQKLIVNPNTLVFNTRAHHTKHNIFNIVNTIATTTAAMSANILDPEWKMHIKSISNKNTVDFLTHPTCSGSVSLGLCVTMVLELFGGYASHESWMTDARQ